MCGKCLFNTDVYQAPTMCETSSKAGEVHKEEDTAALLTELHSLMGSLKSFLLSPDTTLNTIFL